MRPLELKLLRYLGGSVLLIAVPAIFWPLFVPGHVNSRGSHCLWQTKRLATGHLLYAEDHDDRYVNAEGWMDGLAAYVDYESLFHDSQVGKGGYSYAFNAALAGLAQPKHPETVPMVYDSTNLTCNASDRVTSMPKPGRHKDKNSIAYADGHAKAVATP